MRGTLSSNPSASSFSCFIPTRQDPIHHVWWGSPRRCLPSHRHKNGSSRCKRTITAHSFGTFLVPIDISHAVLFPFCLVPISTTSPPPHSAQERLWWTQAVRYCLFLLSISCTHLYLPASSAFVLFDMVLLDIASPPTGIKTAPAGASGVLPVIPWVNLL